MSQSFLSQATELLPTAIFLLFLFLLLTLLIYLSFYLRQKPELQAKRDRSSSTRPDTSSDTSSNTRPNTNSDTNSDTSLDTKPDIPLRINFYDFYRNRAFSMKGQIFSLQGGIFLLHYILLHILPPLWGMVFFLRTDGNFLILIAALLWSFKLHRKVFRDSRR